MDGNTRVAVRIVLLDAASSILLFEGRNLADASDSRRYWFSAGGGVEAAESLLDAASRELEEETGQSDLRVEGPFQRSEFSFLNHGSLQHQVEYFFAARTDDRSIVTTAWTESEKQVVTQWRWWSAAELEATDVIFYPDNLVDLMLSASRIV